MAEKVREFQVRSELVAEILTRCDEVALHSEEPDKIMAHLSQCADAPTARADDRMDGGGRSAYVSTLPAT